MNTALAGIADAFALFPLLATVAGVFIGIIFGSIPGLTATMAIALCLPLTFGVDPVLSLSLLIGLYIGGISGGLITAILLNIPGTPSSIATTFDGYPMTLNGEGGRALGIAIFYSFLGTIFGWLVLFFLSPPLARFALRFGSYEYFAISVFALTLVAGLSGGNLVKGLASAAIGLLVAMVGTAPIDGYKRFTLGIPQLDAGFSLLPVLLGLFAVSEVLSHAQSKPTQTDGTAPRFKLGGFFGVTWASFKESCPNLLRSSLIGAGVGLLPGIGSGTSNLLAYMAARGSSKQPETFGKGNPQGVIASEASNNAGVGAAMVPLVALGIPGDAVTALLLGGFMIHGLQPGPMLFTTDGELVYAIFTSFLIASFAMLFLEYFGIRVFIRILALPKNYLLSLVMVMCILGSFAANNRMFDVYTLLGFGGLGYVMLLFNFPFAPLVLGFILGPMIEQNLRSALMSTRGEFLPILERPIAALFLALAALYLAWSIGRTLFKTWRAARRTDAGGGLQEPSR